MPLIESRRNRGIIPEYSLTGDLLNFLRCNKQYRYQKKAAWSSSNPVQIWFGEFLHKMMAAGYGLYLNNPDQRLASLDWETDLRPLELRIVSQLSSVGINPTSTMYCRHDSSETQSRGCDNNNHPHKTLASKRAEEAIKVIGEMIYPHISKVEQKLKGIRNLIDYQDGIDRSSKYGLTGVVDVISSLNLLNANPFDSIVTAAKSLLDEENMATEFEIIIDYKGSRRPTTDYSSDLTGMHHEWQILEYAWLRELQNERLPVKMGFVIYINELVPSKRDMWDLKLEIHNRSTDIIPRMDSDKKAIRDYNRGDEVPDLSTVFRGNRALKIVPISSEVVNSALINFDKVVRRIESNVCEEQAGGIPVNVWVGNPRDRYCTLCNLKTFCPELASNAEISSDVGTRPQVPPQI